MLVTRLTDPSAIEARLLELAHTTDAKITAPALAYFAPSAIADVQAVLDGLAARDQLSMDVEDDGTVVYAMRGRQKFASRPTPSLRPALVRVPPAPTASPLLAAALTLFIPGAGHLYTGRFVAAILWFLVVGLGYVLILSGLVLHLFAIASAANAAHQLNASVRHLQLAA